MNSPIPSVVTSAARAIDGAISRIVQGANAVTWNPSAEVDRFREAREQTLTILSQINGQQAMWPPRHGVWSIAQIADHLLLSEQMYLQQFQRLVRMAEEGRGKTIEISLKEVNVGFAGVPGEVISMLEMPMRVFNLFVPHVVRETMVRYPLVSALNPKSSQPRSGLSLEKLKEDLAASFEDTEEFFLSPATVDFDELSINHPIMGNNTIPQLFRIVIAHELRHQEQMAAVRSDSNFPKVPREPVNVTQLADLRG